MGKNYTGGEKGDVIGRKEGDGGQELEKMPVVMGGSCQGRG